MLMPGWEVGDKLGVKVASFFPANAARGLASVNAVYALFSAATGEALAIIDGGELTARRTAATSALAADYCARPDAARLLIVGTGRIAANLMEAHTARRPIRRISIWGRTASKAEVLAEKARQHGLAAAAVDDLAAAVAEADIVSCATMSQVETSNNRGI